MSEVGLRVGGGGSGSAAELRKDVQGNGRGKHCKRKD